MTFEEAVSQLEEAIQDAQGAQTLDQLFEAVLKGETGRDIALRKLQEVDQKILKLVGEDRWTEIATES